ncbi:hypothetical protein QQM79_15985 [Marinobacteraceae bacterium S3BR75-40.1]
MLGAVLLYAAECLLLFLVVLLALRVIRLYGESHPTAAALALPSPQPQPERIDTTPEPFSSADILEDYISDFFAAPTPDTESAMRHEAKPESPVPASRKATGGDPSLSRRMMDAMIREARSAQLG